MQRLPCDDEGKSAGSQVRTASEVVANVSLYFVAWSKWCIGLARTAIVYQGRKTKLIDCGRCENGLSVETTAWEGWKEKQSAGKTGR